MSDFDYELKYKLHKNGWLHYTIASKCANVIKGRCPCKTKDVLEAKIRQLEESVERLNKQARGKW